jgi:hypothetical protein
MSESKSNDKWRDRRHECEYVPNTVPPCLLTELRNTTQMEPLGIVLLLVRIVTYGSGAIRSKFDCSHFRYHRGTFHIRVFDI